MAKRLGFIFLIFFTFVFVNYVWTELSRALAATDHSMFVPAGFAINESPRVQNSTAGLSAIDFDLFSKRGSGWNDVTQGYGHTPYSAWYIGGWHNGIDIAASYGAPIFSPSNGTVVATGDQDNYCPHRGFGKFVAVSDPADGIVLWYAHLGTIDVTSGQLIVKGTELATIGTTGRETGTHLHLSVFQANGFSIKNKNGCGPDADGKDVDPVPYLEKLAT